jgi:hypothetical protein
MYQTTRNTFYALVFAGACVYSGCSEPEIDCNPEELGEFTMMCELYRDNPEMRPELDQTIARISNTIDGLLEQNEKLQKQNTQLGEGLDEWRAEIKAQ